MNHSPHERKSRPGGGGSEEVSGGEPLLRSTYTEKLEKKTADKPVHDAYCDDLRSIAFWTKLGSLPLRRRWEAQPGQNPRPIVCYGNMPGEFDDAVWIWQPCGYLVDVGTAWMRSGPEVARKIAQLIPNAEVLDCRGVDYGRVAA